MIAAIFIVINYLLTLLARYLERRLQAVPAGTQGAAGRPDAQPGHGSGRRDVATAAKAP